MSRAEHPGVARLRRRVLRRRLVLIGVLLVVLAASALLWPREQRGPLSVATAAAAPAAGGVVRGVLGAAQQGSRVCYRVAGSGGPALLVLPPGWSATAERALLDPGGAVVAKPGDTVLVTGAPGAVGSVPGCSGTGRVWTVSALSIRS